MGAIVLILGWASAIGILCTASRMIWSFARDKATPLSHIVNRVDRRTRVPIIAVGVICLCGCLLTIIFIGSPTAYNDVISLTITGFYLSYFLPSAFLLYRRIRGEVGTRTERSPEAHFSDTTPEEGSHPVAVAQAALIWGPFHVPSTLGTLNNAYACIYMIFVIFWSVWPPSTPVTASTMNYSVVVTGAVIIFSIIWYFIHGKKVFRGPLVDDEIMRRMTRASVVGQGEERTAVDQIPLDSVAPTPNA